MAQTQRYIIPAAFLTEKASIFKKGQRVNTYLDHETDHLDLLCSIYLDKAKCLPLYCVIDVNELYVVGNLSFYKAGLKLSFTEFVVDLETKFLSEFKEIEFNIKTHYPGKDTLYTFYGYFYDEVEQEIIRYELDQFIEINKILSPDAIIVESIIEPGREEKIWSSNCPDHWFPCLKISLQKQEFKRYSILEVNRLVYNLFSLLVRNNNRLNSINGIKPGSWASI